MENPKLVLKLGNLKLYYFDKAEDAAVWAEALKLEREYYDQLEALFDSGLLSPN